MFDLSHIEDSPQLQIWHSGKKELSLPYTHVLNPHFDYPYPLSFFFSVFLFYPLLYVWHSSIALMQLVPAPIPWSLSDMCSSKHVMLAYAKGKWQHQVCDRQGTVCARVGAANDKLSPSFLSHCFYLLYNGCVWLEESTGWSIRSIHQTAQRGHPQGRTNKATLHVTVM